MGLQTGSIFSNTNYGIPKDEVLPEILSQNGFNTYFCGQWALELIIKNIYLLIMALNISMAFLLTLSI